MVTRTRLQTVLKRILPFWITGLIIGSLLPGETKLKLHTTGPRQRHVLSPDVTLGHHVYHYVSFGLTALLLLFVADRRRFAQWRAVACVMLLGAAIEMAQHLVYRNRLEWWDIRDDAFAALYAFVAWRLCDFLVSLRS